jgi:hypothetical protein
MGSKRKERNSLHKEMQHINSTKPNLGGMQNIKKNLSAHFVKCAII